MLQPDTSNVLATIDSRGTMADTTVTPNRIANLLAPGDRLAEHRLSIRAIAPLNNGNLILYVAGVSGRQSLASLWIYRPGDDLLTLAADSSALADASGLGDSIDLADAQLVACDRGVWLCVHQSDSAALFLLPGDTFSKISLHRAFSSLRQGGRAFRFLSDDQLFARPGGGLGLLRADGGVYAISDAGDVSPDDELRPPGDDRPPWSVPPLETSRDGQGHATRLEFFANMPAVVDPLLPPPANADTSVQYPVVVLKAAGKTTVIERENISVRRGFPVHALRITAWCIEPASGAIVAYDAMSGEIMRLSLTRNNP